MNRDYLPPSLLPPVCSQASSAMVKHHGPLDGMGGPQGPQSHPPPMVCRYSPVRRASEGSRITSQFQGPFQECQQLQKGLHAAAIAASQQQRSNNLLITPSPPLADNSVSLPGSPMHCKAFVDERSSAGATAGTLPDITVPHDVLLSLVPGLEKLVQENRLQIDTANSILHTRTMPYEVGHQLGLVRGGGSPAGAGGGGTLLLDAGMNLLQLQHSQSVSPLNATLRHHGGGGAGIGAGYGGAGGRPTGFPMLGGGMQPSYIAGGGGGGGAFGNPYAFQNLMAAPGGAMSTVNASSTGMCHLSGLEYPGSNSNSGCPSPVYYASGCSSPILPGPPASIVSGCSGNMSGSGSGGGGGGTGSASAGGGGAASPMHQITRGISTLNTGGGGGSATGSTTMAGGSITRGTSSAVTAAFPPSVACNEPLDLSMDIVNSVEIDFSGRIVGGCYSGATTPVNYFDPKNYGLLPPPPPQTMRICATPPTSPNNLCIIQEEHPTATGTTAAGGAGTAFKSHSANGSPEDLSFQHTHPQICLTDVQGSEITLVALSDSSHGDSDDSLNCPTGGSSATTSGLGFSGLLITEPSSDMPSITRGVGRKASLDTENNSTATASSNSAKLDTSDISESYVRRGSDKSLGFSDDSLSNDSNHSNLSPSQEPSAASSGFKSADSYSEQDGGRLSPDSLGEGGARRSDECYELPLPQECSSLDSVRILEMVKRTLDSTMPPKGCVYGVTGSGGGHGSKSASGMDSNPLGDGGGGSRSTAAGGEDRSSHGAPGGADGGVTGSARSGNGANSEARSNLSLEFSGGLQIELQVYEGRNSKDSNTSKGIKLRRISGDQYEYGKLCQQLITSLTV
ncbi:AGAP006412-PA [Anopheles gambiae str. PEST]|uniref:AGAP006412-PA n=1 Tax=Anopheles gambiae TaxID=7165 RepID=A0NES7_ANOGA|nr:AGAP006412-PA [Anopheles gambiae str. PEST]